jgi:3-oxoadipate enol-lactonase
MSAPAEVDEPGLRMPLGQRVELEGRGTTFVRSVEGPPGAPTVVLVHGWIASGGMNWFKVFDPLSARYHVLAPDLRGHGRGLRTRQRFRLADCADDLAQLLRQRGQGPVVVAGYSMGGPVAQLLWHRHPDVVAGLVLCATSHRFVVGARERLVFATMMAAAVGTTRVGGWMAAAPSAWARQMVPWQPGGRAETVRRFAADEMRRHDWRLVMEAGGAIGRYNARRWIGTVDVPTAVVVTALDRAIEPSEQARMAFAIPGATIFRVEDGHVACAGERFTAPFLAACDDVATRAGLR